MTEPDFPLREHFPDMWNAIAADWKAAPEDSDYPHLSSRQRSLLSKFTAVGLMGSIVVFEADSGYTKQEVERKLSSAIKQVLKSKLGMDVTLAVSSHNNAQSPAGGHDEQDDEHHADHRGDHGDHSDRHSENRDHADHDDHTSNNDADHGEHDQHTESRDPRSPRPTGTPAHSASPSHRQPHGPSQVSGSFSQVTPGIDAATNTPDQTGRSDSHADRSPRTAADFSDSEMSAVHPGGAAGVGGQRPQPRPGVRQPGSPNQTSELDVPLNKDYTFDNFVVGSSNNFAAAACRAVAEAPARSYNPLFIWGESGLGKTHLLHSIGHYARQLYPNMGVRYISSEELTNDFINSIANDRREAFKRNYRNLDMLIVDDIQFLQGKESTQEEFFHTFNALHQANKQIVLSSDRHPRQLTTLEDRLRTRFEGGLITDIQTPDLETRIAILTKKDEAEGVYLPEEVKELIASRYEKSIRELEGARIRITAHCSINKEPITAEVAERVMRDILPEDQDVKIVPQHVIDIVAEYFNLTEDDLLGKSRSKRIAQPRKIAMYLCRELTDLSLPKVGESFGNRDHTTVMHAERGIRKEMSLDKKVLDQVQTLSQKIKVYARG